MGSAEPEPRIHGAGAFLLAYPVSNIGCGPASAMDRLRRFRRFIDGCLLRPHSWAMRRWPMFPAARPVLLVVVGSASLAAATLAPVISSESGSALFRSYCASCHGMTARGDGPLAANLRVAPADLTRIAKRNHGKYDAEKVRRAIDGRDAKEIHGGSDMPVWGDAFKRAGEGYDEAKVKERIDALVDYLAALQQP